MASANATKPTRDSRHLPTVESWKTSHSKAATEQAAEHDADLPHDRAVGRRDDRRAVSQNAAANSSSPAAAQP